MFLSIFLNLHPWMGPDLIDCWSLRTIFGKEFHNKILELVRQTALFVEFREILVKFSMSNKIVPVIALSCFSKWEKTSYETEDQDTDRKNVNLFSVVNLSFLDLWCHVALCPVVAGEFLNAFICCKAKVK